MTWPIDIPGVKPYYADENIVILHGDAREILPLLPDSCADLILTDPVWPNASPQLEGTDRPYELFAEVAREFSRLSGRAVIQLGCNSDPRFLAGVPKEMPFFRACWLEYARPHYQGNLMYTGDVAYAFGKFRRPEGATVIPGRYMSSESNGQSPGHPSPRKPQHIRWLIRWFSHQGDVILDPFLGSGTTALVAKNSGRRCIGIEINQGYCRLAAERVQAQGVLPLEVTP